MDKLKTATGKELDSDYIATIPSPAQAYIRICNLPLSDVATIFSDFSETFQLWQGKHYLAHYTKLIALVPEDGAIKVVLAKET